MFKRLMLVAALMVVTVAGQSFAADFLKMIPEDADFVLQLNVSKILAMPEVQKQINDGFAKEPEKKKTYEELKGKTGFDPLKDISSFVLFSSGSVKEGAEALAGAIVEGKYDIEKIISVIKEDEDFKKDAELTVIDGFNAIVPKNTKDGYGMFLDNQFVAVGSQSGVDAIKAVKLGKAKNVENKKDFYAILSKLDTKSTVCGAGLLPKAFKEKVAKNPNAAAFANINLFRFDFNNDANMVFNLSAEIDDAKNVETVMTQLNGYVAMIKMFAAQEPAVAEIVNMLTVTSEGTSVKMGLNVPAEKLAELKAKLEEKAKQMQEQKANDANAPRE